MTFYREFLQRELARRKARNPRYSLRAFARHLETDPSALSRILKGKQALSPRLCTELLRRLTLSQDDRASFVSSVVEDRSKREYLSILSQVSQVEPSPLGPEPYADPSARPGAARQEAACAG